jgi:hypothetical protein
MTPSPRIRLARTSTSIVVCLTLLGSPLLADAWPVPTDGPSRGEALASPQDPAPGAITADSPALLADATTAIRPQTPPASPDSGAARSPTPFYRKKTFLLGTATALLAGVLAVVLGSGHDRKALPGDTNLPGFPPPPSSQP